MKHLIIYAHPNPGSLNAHLKNTLVDYLAFGNHEIEVRDLYELKFNPILSSEDIAGQLQGMVSDDVKTEQQWISWAERITFIYPIWWTGLPAIMKGYIERVFSYGYAYSYTNGVQQGLLKGKQAVIINTHGKSATEYQLNGVGEALTLTADKGLYGYCGLEILKHFMFDRADRPAAESIANWEAQITAV